MTQSYPLQWPIGRPRTSYPDRAKFGNYSFARVRDDLLAEMRRMGATNVVLSTNIQLRQDGLPYSNRAQPEDRGVAIYFTWKKKAFVLACDRWQRIEDNVRALALSIAAMRGLDRWGGGNMVEQAFSGFTALPSPSADNRANWRTILKCGPAATRKDIDLSYRTLAYAAHPDKGGSHEAMSILNAARAEAYNEVTK